ncbi:hypothetical protein CK203_050578 [Vitis vinifera]|uniref:Uncharacterized protein n=1 Tax=Vitis vinifera TaxID=29760 RepID=A0A438GFJ4_VITVI|nr:hypothetical protein CK203_050578 [Vitis vinifera]
MLCFHQALYADKGIEAKASHSRLRDRCQLVILFHWNVSVAGTQLVQGCSEEGTTSMKENVEQRNLLRAPFLSKGKQKMRNIAKGEDGAVLRVLWVVLIPSLPFHSPFSGMAPLYPSPSAIDLSIPAFQSQSVGIPNHDDAVPQLARLNLLFESFNYDKTKPNSPHGAPIMGIVSQGDIEFSQMGGSKLKLSFPQSLQEVLPRWTSDHWPIVLDTNPFKWVQHLLGALSSNLAVQRAIRKGELEEIILKEEIHWRQKAKVKWVKDGIAAQSCFTKWLTGDETKNFIKFLENERGLVLDNSREHHRGDITYFKKLYLSPLGESWRVEEEYSRRPSTPLNGAFVKGRQILDAVLIANEIVDEKRHQGRKSCIQDRL